MLKIKIMKYKNYTKEYLTNSIKYLREEIRQTQYRIQSFECQIKKEKLKLCNTDQPHNHLWKLRDQLNYQKTILLMYRKHLKQQDIILNQMFNKQSLS